MTPTNLATRKIAFTGGEPFVNPEMLAMTRSALPLKVALVVLTDATLPMRRFDNPLGNQKAVLGARHTTHISLNH